MSSPEISPPKAIIFDCWNTLYTTGTGSSLRRISHRLIHHPFNYRLVKAFEESYMLAPSDNLVDPTRDFLHSLHLPAFKPLIKRIVAGLEDSLEHQKPFDDTEAELKKLKKEGYKLGLITNSWKQAFENLDKKCQVRKRFDVVITSYEAGMIKPDPRIFKLALKQLGVKPHEALMVGDSLPDDVKAARSAGLKAILLDRWGRHPKHRPRIDSLADLDEVLNGTRFKQLFLEQK